MTKPTPNLAELMAALAAADEAFIAAYDAYIKDAPTDFPNAAKQEGEIK